MSNDYVIEKIIDSASNEIIEIRKELCFRCHNPIPLNSMGHASCLRQSREEEATEKERQRREQCLRQFGSVLNAFEHRRRLFPNDKVDGTESYTHQLAREAEEKRQAHFEMLRDRDERKQRLPWLEQQVQSLKAQISRDEEEAAKEQKQ